MQTHILSVTQLTGRIKDLLEGSFPEVWVEGEISNLTIPHSGHAYFTLKDEHAQIRAVLFRSSQRFLKFTLQHGLKIICRCRVSVYEARGEYQLIVDYLEPGGVGALQLAFEQLKTRLEKEGLFDPARKKPLPVLPARIGLITSATGAAIRDILQVIRRRHPKIHILLYPVPVQGAEAAPSIMEAVRYFNRSHGADVLIVGRGGGSLEDLWAFNDEGVAREIAASRIPVISAVGHETDYTIADFVADLRAPTPSAAAEMVVRGEEHFRENIRTLEQNLIRTIRERIGSRRETLRGSLLKLGDPRRSLEQHVQHLDDLDHRMRLGLRHRMHRDRTRFGAATTGLTHLNPLGILSRGYSITRLHPSGRIVKDAREVQSEDLICTKLHRGELLSRVEKTSVEGHHCTAERARPNNMK